MALENEFATQATTIGELNGLVQTLMKSALQQMPDSELQFHLKHSESAAEATNQDIQIYDSVGRSKSKQTRNRRNG